MNANIVGNLVVPFFIFLALAIWNGIEGGSAAVLQGYAVSLNMLIGIALVILIAFLITGQAQVLVTRHMPTVLEFLNGKHGIWGSTGAGIITPTLSAYPIVEELWRKGLAPIGVILSIILTTRLLNFQTMLFFLPFLGWNLTIIFAGVSVVIILLFVCIARALS
jgi:hypothetical protein